MPRPLLSPKHQETLKNFLGLAALIVISLIFIAASFACIAFKVDFSGDIIKDIGLPLMFSSITLMFGTALLASIIKSLVR